MAALTAWDVIMLIVWIALSWHIGQQAERSGRRFGPFFLLAVLLTPVIGWLVLITKDARSDGHPRRQLPWLFWVYVALGGAFLVLSPFSGDLTVTLSTWTAVVWVALLIGLAVGSTLSWKLLLLYSGSMTLGIFFSAADWDPWIMIFTLTSLAQFIVLLTPSIRPGSPSRGAPATASA